MSVLNTAYPADILALYQNNIDIIARANILENMSAICTLAVYCTGFKITVFETHVEQYRDKTHLAVEMSISTQNGNQFNYDDLCNVLLFLYKVGINVGGDFVFHQSAFIFSTFNKIKAEPARALHFAYAKHSKERVIMSPKNGPVARIPTHYTKADLSFVINMESTNYAKIQSSLKTIYEITPAPTPLPLSRFSKFIDNALLTQLDADDYGELQNEHNIFHNMLDLLEPPLNETEKAAIADLFEKMHTVPKENNNDA